MFLVLKKLGVRKGHHEQPRQVVAPSQQGSERQSTPGPHEGGHACTAQLLGVTTGLCASQGAGKRCWGTCKWTNVEVQKEFNGIQGRPHAWVQRRQSRGGEEAAQRAARRKGGREENRAAGNKFFRASSTGKYIFVKDFYTLCFSEEIKITSQQLGAQLNFECYCRTEGKGP